MSEETKAIVRRFIEHFNDPENRTAYFELYHPDAVLHGYQGVEPGLEGIKRFYNASWEAFPDGRLTIDDMIAEGDKVGCRFTFRGTHRGDFMGIPPTGEEVILRGITILRFAGRKCVERWSQADFLGVMQQLGAVPSSG